MSRRNLVIVLAVVTGVALELSIEALSGRREAWDSQYYWMLGVPIAGLIALLVGYLAEKSDWLWAAAIIPAQVVTMMATSGDLGLDGIIMMPFMAGLASILGAPFVGASYVGSWLRRGTVREASSEM